MPAPWSISDGGTRLDHQHTMNEETMNDIETKTPIQVTVFGNQFLESCFSGG